MERTRRRFYLLAGLALAFAGAAGFADYQGDIKHYQKFFADKFPGIPQDELANGAYALNKALRENWEAIEEFPPYEPFMDAGEKMWNTPFANGKTYKDCFPDGPGIGHHYPSWDHKQGMVMTLPLAINQCRERHNEKPFKYMKGPVVDILAYVAYQSRGKITNVVVPGDDPRALEAYNKGKEFYFKRRGQLNFSCAHCHFNSAGQSLRTDILSTAVGQTTGWPVYRSKWGTAGTLHRRYSGCNKQVRAKPPAAQSEDFRNLEYFHTSLSNGLPYNGPSARK